MAEQEYDSSGVPTFESVREKIETRYETSLGAAELDAETAEGHSVEEQYEARQQAAADRLARRHFLTHDESGSIAAITAGLVGLHATDPATPYLSLWARHANFCTTD